MKKSILLGLSATTLAMAAIVGANLSKAALKADAAGTLTGVYFEVNRIKSNAPTASKFSVFTWDGGTNSKWVSTTEVDDKTVFADGLYNNIILVWGNSAWAGNDWSGKLGQTVDITRASASFNAVWADPEDVKEEVKANAGMYEMPLATLSIGGDEQLMDLHLEKNNDQRFASVNINTEQDILITLDETEYGYDELEAGCKDMFKAGTGKAFQVKSNSKYELYLKSNGKIWAQIDSNIEANNFATDFLNDIACNDGVTAPNVTKWEEYETRYGSMTAGGKGKFTSATANPSGTVVEQAVARYVYIVSKYNTAEVKTYHEYITRGDIVYRGTSANVVENISASNDAATYVSIAAIGTIAAVGAFLFIKKKREN